MKRTLLLLTTALVAFVLTVFGGEPKVGAAYVARLYGASAVTVHGTSVDVITGWPTNLAVNTGLAVRSLAAAGSQVSDGQLDAIFQDVVYTNSTTIWQLFYNDMRWNGTSAAGWFMSSNSALAGAIYLSIPDSKKIFRANTATTGTWHNNPGAYYGGGGSYASTTGDSRTWTNYGTVSYIALLGTVAGGAAMATVTIDGTIVSTNDTKSVFSTNGNGRIYAPLFLRYPGLTDGPHVITLTVIASGGSDLVWLWAAGNGGASSQLGPNLVLPDCLRMSAAGYAAGAPFTNGTDTAHATANKLVQDIVNILDDDGFNVARAYVSTSVDPDTGILSDKVHENATGKIQNANAVETALSLLARQRPGAARWRGYLELGQNFSSVGELRLGDQKGIGFRSSATPTDAGEIIGGDGAAFGVESFHITIQNLRPQAVGERTALRFKTGTAAASQTNLLGRINYELRQGSPMISLVSFDMNVGGNLNEFLGTSTNTTVRVNRFHVGNVLTEPGANNAGVQGKLAIGLGAAPTYPLDVKETTANGIVARLQYNDPTTSGDLSTSEAIRLQNTDTTAGARFGIRVLIGNQEIGGFMWNRTGSDSGGMNIIGASNNVQRVVMGTDASQRANFPQGFIAAPITKAQRDAMTASNGWVIYQSDNTPGFRFYQAGAWVNMLGVPDP